MSLDPESQKRVEEFRALLQAAGMDRVPAPLPSPTSSTRLSWSDMTSVAALVLSILSVVWTGGVIYGTVQEHDRRILALEQVDREREPLLRQMHGQLSRIEADLAALKDRP